MLRPCTVFYSFHDTHPTYSINNCEFRKNVYRRHAADHDMFIRGDKKMYDVYIYKYARFDSKFFNEITSSFFYFTLS